MGRIGRYFHEEMNKTRPLYVVLCGGVLWTAALTVRLTTAAPYVFLHNMAGQVALPPTWLMSLLWLGFFFLIGAAWGYVLGLKGHRPRRDTWRFRGSMYFLLSVVCALLWYRLLFGAWAVFLSWLFLLADLAVTLVTALCWWRVSRAVGVILLVFALFLLFLFGCQLAIICHL